MSWRIGSDGRASRREGLLSLHGGKGRQAEIGQASGAYSPHRIEEKTRITSGGRIQSEDGSAEIFIRERAEGIPEAWFPVFEGAAFI